MGKEDWDFYRSYDRSRSPSPEPSVQHLKVLPADFARPSWITEKYYVYALGVAHYITEEQVQEINKMKLKQNEEIKKAIREAFLDSEYGLTDEDVDKIKENFADDLDEFIKSIIKV